MTLGEIYQTFVLGIYPIKIRRMPRMLNGDRKRTQQILIMDFTIFSLSDTLKSIAF